MTSRNIKTAFLFLLSIVTSPLRLKRNVHASYFTENKFNFVGFNADVNKITIRVNYGQGHWKALNTSKYFLFGCYFPACRAGFCEGTLKS